MVLSLAAVFVALGVLIVAAPGFGAWIFGVPAPEGEALVYLQALGIRDLAFGLGLGVLGLVAPRRTVGLWLAASAVIPLGDMALLTATRGLAPQLALHAASALVIAGTAAWLLRTAREDHA
jgi:hypothetical protein